MTAREIANKLKVGKSTILRWRSQGCPCRVTKAGVLTFSLPEVTRWRAKHIHAAAPLNVDALSARARKELASVKLLEHKLSQRRLELVPAAEVRAMFDKVAEITRRACAELACAVAPLLAKESDQHACHTLLVKETRAMLIAMSNTMKGNA